MTQSNHENQIKKLQNKVNDLEKERHQTYEILSQTDAKIEGLQASEMMNYINYLKQQLTQKSLQHLKELDEFFESEQTSSAQLIDFTLAMQENMNFRQKHYNDVSRRQLETREQMIQ